MRRRNSKPFFRSKKQAYYCWIDGRLRALGKKKNLAQARYRELLAARDRADGRAAWTVRDCFDHYLEYAATLGANSLRNRRLTLEAFLREARCGDLPCPDLAVDRLEAWVRSKSWSPSTARTKINHVMAAFNYCVRRGKIRENPLRGVSKPRWERRKHVLAAGDERRVYEASTGPFRDILAVLRSTGARPSELCNARVGHYADGVITLDRHKSDESGEPRTIYLTATAREIVERLIGGRDGGAIFRNSRGGPWTPDTLYRRFRRIARRLGLAEGAFPYAIRHRYASDVINDGNANPALVAKAMGHADLNMLLKHYLREDPEAVRRALESVGRK